MQVVEYGHYYEAQGPTEGTIQSIEIFNMLRQKGYFSKQLYTILFIDDVHDVNPFESDISDEKIDFDTLGFNKRIFESKTKTSAHQLIQNMTNNNLPIKHKDGCDFLLNGGKNHIQLKKDGLPSCVMMDCALTLVKSKYGNHIINILPISYKKQQENLHKVIYELSHSGIIQSNIHLESLLFNSNTSKIDVMKTSLSPAKIHTLTF